MKLDVNAEDYIKPKEPTMGLTNTKTPYIGFTYPKTKEQIQKEFQELLIQNKKAKMPKNYINCYLAKRSKNLAIITEYEKQYDKQNFRYKLTPRDQTISTKTIKKLMKNTHKQIDIKEIFDRIMIQIKKYVYLKNEAEYQIMALYSILTYKYLHFDFTPIIHLNGEPGTGKSQLSKIIMKIGFNPSLTVSTTKSSFFRRIDRKRGLYCIDEKEKLEEHEKELLNGCTYEGNIHTVTEKKNDELIDTDFHIYTPVILACINDVYGATSTRMIKIETLKPPRKHNKYQVLKLNQDNSEWQEIRDQLIIWSITTYNENKSLLDVTQEYEELLTNRAVDSWKIILNQSKKVGVYDSIVKYIKNYYLDQLEELQDTDLNLTFLKYIYNLGDRTDWVSGKNMYLEFSNILTEKQRDFFTKTRFGKLLRRIGYNLMNHNKKRTHRGVEYKLNQNMVKDYINSNYEINLDLLNNLEDHPIMDYRNL